MGADDRWERVIREAIIDLERTPRDFVGLVDLRPRLDQRGTSREAQDRHLQRLSREGKLHLVPESNRKVLTDIDHAAAIHVGGDDCHLVQWDGDR